MKKYKIKFSKLARQDLLDINHYIKYTLLEPNIANKLIKRIHSKISKLEEKPKIYPVISDDYIKKLSLRKLIINNYIVFYKVIDDRCEVQIARIIYGKREWINLIV